MPRNNRSACDQRSLQYLIPFHHKICNDTTQDNINISGQKNKPTLRDNAFNTHHVAEKMRRQCAWRYMFAAKTTQHRVTTVRTLDEICRKKPVSYMSNIGFNVQQKLTVGSYLSIL